jgi:hypothetical protein
MTLSTVALAVFVSVCSAAAGVQYGWYENGTLVPDNPGRGHDGPFLAQLSLTDDPDALYERWNTKPGNFQIKAVEEAAPGTVIEAVVFFAHCEANALGNCDIRGIGTVLLDDGFAVAKDVEIPIYVDHPQPPGATLGIAESGMKLQIEPEETSYRFEVSVTDRIANRTVKLVRELKVVAR